MSGSARHMAAMKVIIPTFTIEAMRGDSSDVDDDVNAAAGTGLFCITDAAWNSPPPTEANVGKNRSCCCFVCCCRLRGRIRLQERDMVVGKYRSLLILL